MMEVGILSVHVLYVFFIGAIILFMLLRKDTTFISSIRHFYHIAMGQPFTFSFCQQFIPQLYLCCRRTAAHDFHHLLYRFDE